MSFRAYYYLGTQQTIYAYRYDDTDTLMNELEEWYAFVEMPSVAQAPEVFRRGFKGGGY
jgi:hypothetical protein